MTNSLEDMNVKNRPDKLVSYFKRLEIEIPEEEIDCQFNDLKRLLYTERRRRAGRFLYWSAGIAASILMACIYFHHHEKSRMPLMDYVSNLYENNPSPQSRDDGDFICVNVPVTSVCQVDLPDGSFVKINAGTTVVYPREFSGTPEREIYVDGEIFIDVVRDEDRPFIVRTSNCDVCVHGTAFNVFSSREENLSQVVLLRGKVSVRNKCDQFVELMPNEAVSLKNNHFGRKKPVNAEDYIAWTQGKLLFADKSTVDIIKELSRFYGVEITYDPGIEGLNPKGTVDLNVPIEKVLCRISKTIPVKVHKTSRGYHLSIQNDLK